MLEFLSVYVHPHVDNMTLSASFYGISNPFMKILRYENRYGKLFRRCSAVDGPAEQTSGILQSHYFFSAYFKVKGNC